MEEIKIDLACGDRKKDGFVGVDIAPISGVDIVFDIQTYPWPFEDNSVDEVYCSHYMEHIPHDIKNPNDNRDGFIQFMDELYRILKVGGKVNITVPYYTSMRAFQDPTHQRFMCEASFYYVNKQWRELNKLLHYNMNCDFDANFSYYVTNELTLKSDELRNNAFKHYWNAVDDLMVELIKR